MVGDKDIVTQAIRQTTPSLSLDIERTQHMLRQHGLSHEAKPSSCDVWQPIEKLAHKNNSDLSKKTVRDYF